MATTTNGDVKAQTISYPEEDKLGPLGSKPATLFDPIDLRKALLSEFATAVSDAKQAATLADTSTNKAVHSARKALRRARSVLALVARALPKSERRAVRKALQEARRGLSTMRDHAVAPETLGELALGAEDRDTANRVLDTAAQALPELAEIKQLLAEAATRAAAQLDALEASLPAEIEWEVVLDGIKDVYNAARRARRAGKRSKSWFHAWRRRSKELTYQIDWLARHAGARTAAIHGEIDGVTDQLSAAVDLIMVREFVETHAQGTTPAAIEHLTAAIDAQLGDLMKEGRRAGRDAYRQKPRKFGKRIEKAARRDLAPVDDIEPNAETSVD